ncbi:hypothetical protein BHE74_00059441 [Ensete ventricosum]|nr:hypothetical protein BHE74_00059441 [Ensete ventricosum]
MVYKQHVPVTCLNCTLEHTEQYVCVCVCVCVYIKSKKEAYATSTASPAPLLLITSDEEKNVVSISSSVAFDKDVKGRRHLRPSAKKKPSRCLVSLPPGSESSREGGTRSGRIEVLLILPLIQGPSLSSSFSLDASSLTAARLIPPGSKQRRSKSTITDLLRG